MFNGLSKVPAKKQAAIASGLIWVGGMAALFGLLMVMGFSETTEEECTGQLFWRECVDVEKPLSGRVTYLVVGIVLFAVALVCALAALRLTTLKGHLKRYMAILHGVESIGVQQIAGITTLSPSKVRDEIQSMIDSGMISDFYIDYGADEVVSRKYIPKRSHKTVVKCSECGGNNEVIIGITKHCSFCGQPLLLGTA